MRRVAWALVLVLAGCRGSLAKIDALRDGLAKGDAAAIAEATAPLPKCTDLTPYALAPKDPSPRDTGCFADIANALGSKKGFTTMLPDQASAATVAAVLTRDGRGDLFAQNDIWLGALKGSQGSGFDALRLAVARKMVEAGPAVGRKLEEDKDARAAMKAIAAAVPGACPTYFLLGAGDQKLPAELDPDHSACVQRDLARREGPGARYGTGVMRALEGSLALWRETERALRQGRQKSAPIVAAAFEEKLKAVEAITLKIETKKIEATVSNESLTNLGDMHAEAGVVLFRKRDADGGAGDAAAPDAGAAAHP